jgi:ABC-type branched-subunit amino acid transport system permease subunit
MAFCNRPLVVVGVVAFNKLWFLAAQQYVLGVIIMSGKTIREKKKDNHKEVPLVVWVWMFGLGFVSYVVARIVLDGYPHPLHWLSGVVGAVVGFLVGWIWYRWKGDMI